MSFRIQDPWFFCSIHTCVTGNNQNCQKTVWSFCLRVCNWLRHPHVLLNLHKSCHAFHAWLARLGDGKIKQIIWKFNEIHDRSNQVCFLRNKPQNDQHCCVWLRTTKGKVTASFDTQLPVARQARLKVSIYIGRAEFIGWKPGIQR